MKYIGSCLRKLCESFTEERYLIGEKKIQDFLFASVSLNFELCMTLYQKKKIKMLYMYKIVNEITTKMIINLGMHKISNSLLSNE